MDSIFVFLTKVLTLRLRHDFSITSWIRTPKHNIEVGGVLKSFHPLGLAVDCTLDNPANTQDLIRDAKRLGLDAIPESDHVHLEPKG